MPAVSSFYATRHAAAKIAEEQRRAGSPLHSEFWLPRGLRNLNLDTASPIEITLHFSALQRAVSNFVRILTGQNIPVMYSTGLQSYAYDEAMQDRVVLSATRDMRKLDVQVGLALHEASHIIHSKVGKYSSPYAIPLFEFLGMLPSLEGERLTMMTPGMEERMKVLGLTQNNIRSLLRLILNLIEDARIDELSYTNYPGYRPYYDALYGFYWYSPRMEQLLNDPKTRVPTVENYQFHLTGISYESFDVNALPGLPAIINTLRLDRVQRFNRDRKWTSYKSSLIYNKDGVTRVPHLCMPDMVQTALQVVDLILEHAEPIQPGATCVVPTPTTSIYQRGKGLDTMDDGSPEGERDGLVSTYDPENLDIHDTPPSQMVTHDPKDVIEEIHKLVKAIDGNIDKIAINKELENALGVTKQVKTEITYNTFEGKDVPVIVYHRLTSALLDMPDFPFAEVDYGNALAVERGIAMGNLLAHKLRIMSEESALVHTRLSSGRLDRRLIAGLGYDVEQVFQQTTMERYQPVAIHLSIDASNSMRGKKFDNAIALAVALAQAASKIAKLDVSISLRNSSHHPMLLIAYDSRVDNISKVRSMFPRLGPHGGTPEGLVYGPLHEIVIGSKSGSHYFINLSDGMPDYHPSKDSYYIGPGAWQHTAHEVQKLRDAGVHVMAYYITSDPDSDKNILASEGFRKMYGKGARFINPENIMEIAKTINGMFVRDDS